MKSFELQHKILRRTLAILVASIVSVALGSISRTAYAQVAGPANVHVTISAPTQVKAGDIIHLRLQTDGNVAVGGFEALVLYSHTDAEFVGFDPASPLGDASTGQLIAPEMDLGSAVGYYTCATAPCLAQRAIQVQAAAAPGLLVDVQLHALTTGQLEVKITHLQLVDLTGAPIPLAEVPSGVVIQVGDGGPRLSAPPDAWTLNGNGNSAVIASVNAADITKDGGISHSDVMEVAMAWETVHESGQPCDGRETSADINADGCVNIVDVQTAASYAGNQPAAASAPQEGNQTFIPQAGSGEATVTQAAGQPFVVNSAGDEHDSDTTDNLCLTSAQTCTLRAAIEQANATPGSDIINFAIPGDGTHTIQLLNRLPSLHDETGGTVIDGYSQPGSSPNTDPVVSNAHIRVEIRGNGYAAFDGLAITSVGNAVKGLAFYDLKRCFWIYGSGAHDNVLTGDFIGTNAAATSSATKTSDGQAHGIHMEQGAHQNHIGGTSPAERNVVSGNARSGIGLWHVGTNDNVIINNIVGLRPDGIHSLHNRQQGVDINYGSSHNIVGGTKPGERNVVSGNGHNGIEVSHTKDSTLNEIRGNFIGTDASGEGGNSDTGNAYFGLSLHDGVTNNTVAQNVIGSNLYGGIVLDNFGNCCVTINTIENNWIGVSPGGRDIGNRGITEGIGISVTAMQTHIGPGNVIAYNRIGIQLRDDDNTGNTISNTITQNSIFSNSVFGIDIAPVGQANPNDADDLDAGPNQQLNFPVLQSASLTQATGSACAGCRVEIFIADRHLLTNGQGQTFVGTAVADANGAFTATLQNVNYGDYLTATATDPGGNTSEFSLNFLVNNPANQPPTAVDDSATTEAGMPTIIDVLANDVDPESDALSIVAISKVAHGTVSIHGPLVVYTPTVKFSGTDTFTYTVSDNISGSSVAKVTVTVVKEPSGTNGAGVKIAPESINLAMGGHPVSYTIVLESQPTAAVTLTILADAPLVVTPDHLVFTPDNWKQPQTVTVSVVQTDVVFAAQESVVHHGVKSDDLDYNNLGAPNLVVDITVVDITVKETLFLPTVMH